MRGISLWRNQYNAGACKINERICKERCTEDVYPATAREFFHKMENLKKVGAPEVSYIPLLGYIAPDFCFPSISKKILCLKSRETAVILIPLPFAFVLLFCGNPGKEEIMKKIAAGLFLFLLLGSVFAFGQKDTAAGEPAEKPEQIVLHILAGQSSTDVGIEDLICAAVAEKYPEITLEWECADWGEDFQAKMRACIPSGQLPDILIGKSQDVATYASMGLLGDMTGKPYLEEMMEAAKPGVTLDGKVYGLTYNALYQGVYYNKALFAEYGVQVPETLAEMDEAIRIFEAAGITPFATHFSDTWSIGNIAMQFAVNEVFRATPDWGDLFRAGKVRFSSSPDYRICYLQCKEIYDHTWSGQTFFMDEQACDTRLVMGEAAMKVSGSWSIQSFLDIDESFDFGIFPFPNRAGDAKLLFEPNLTFMKIASSPYQEEIDKVLTVIAEDKTLALEILNYTKTAPMIKGVTPTFPNPSQPDIDRYAAEGRIQDVNIGNIQLKWGNFQEANARDLADYMRGKLTLEQALEAADARQAESKAREP